MTVPPPSIRIILFAGVLYLAALIVLGRLDLAAGGVATGWAVDRAEVDTINALPSADDADVAARRIIRGSVRTRSGVPLAGARITVRKNAEAGGAIVLGRTPRLNLVTTGFSRSDGTFELDVGSADLPLELEIVPPFPAATVNHGIRDSETEATVVFPDPSINAVCIESPLRADWDAQPMTLEVRTRIAGPRWPLPEADPDGVTRFPAVVENEFQFEVVATTRRGSTSSRRLSPWHRSQACVLPLGDRRRLDVVILERVTRQPIVGARVEISPYWGGSRWTAAPGITDRSGRVTIEVPDESADPATSNGSGRFFRNGPDTRIHVTAEGRGDVDEVIRLDDFHREIVLEMRSDSTGACQGYVVDALGDPVRGRLRIGSPDRESVVHVSTDEDGQFSTTSLAPSDRYSTPTVFEFIGLDRRGQPVEGLFFVRPQGSPRSTHSLRLACPRPGTIRRRAVDVLITDAEDRPLPGSWVEIMGIRRHAGDDGRVHWEFLVPGGMSDVEAGVERPIASTERSRFPERDDDDLEFFARALDGKRHLGGIRIGCEGYRTRSTRPHDDWAYLPARIVLERERDLALLVVDETDSPVPGASLYFPREGRADTSYRGWPRIDEYTDADGRFRGQGFRFGDTPVRVRPPGGSDHEVTIPAGVLDYRIRLPIRFEARHDVEIKVSTRPRGRADELELVVHPLWTKSLPVIRRRFEGPDGAMTLRSLFTGGGQIEFRHRGRVMLRDQLFVDAEFHFEGMNEYVVELGD
ncbi:MAG: carboxypeptidase-like regulatory domain-containing protein [Planctomycetota bacterium]